MLLILERHRWMSKTEWRSRDVQRSLPPLDASAIVCGMWRKQGRSEVVRFDVDSGRLEEGIGRTFRARFADGYAVVRLMQPKAPVGRLQPWTPLRVILNSRTSWDSGQLYWVRDYHLVLCVEPEQPLGEVRIVDMQQDLL